MPPPVQTLLGFDYGLSRIGTAVGQTATGTATPQGTVTATDGAADFEAIAALIESWQPDRLVVGIPYNMDGSEGGLTQRALRFARQLEGRFRLPVETVDERLSSLEAEEGLREARQTGRKRRRVRRDEVDATAAAIILQRWMRGEGQPEGRGGPD